MARCSGGPLSFVPSFHILLGTHEEVPPQSFHFGDIHDALASSIAVFDSYAALLALKSGEDDVDPARIHDEDAPGAPDPLSSVSSTGHCHRCKRHRRVFRCVNKLEITVWRNGEICSELERCRRPFCAACLEKHSVALTDELQLLRCPSCLAVCSCSSCRRSRGRASNGDEPGGAPEEALAPKQLAEHLAAAPSCEIPADGRLGTPSGAEPLATDRPVDSTRALCRDHEHAGSTAHRLRFKAVCASCQAVMRLCTSPAPRSYPFFVVKACRRCAAEFVVRVKSPGEPVSTAPADEALACSALVQMASGWQVSLEARSTPPPPAKRPRRDRSMTVTCSSCSQALTFVLPADLPHNVVHVYPKCPHCNQSLQFKVADIFTSGATACA